MQKVLLIGYLGPRPGSQIRRTGHGHRTVLGCQHRTVEGQKRRTAGTHRVVRGEGVRPKG
jgi:hypothetical protein